MDERCISLKCLLVIVSLFCLLDTRLAIAISVDKLKKDNHTIREHRKIHDQKPAASKFNYRMHGLNGHHLFNNGDQLKTLYTNLGSANIQVQLKYITGTGLLSPLIIRASDLGLAPEQAQMQGLPDFLNDFNNLNNQNQFSMGRPPNKNRQPHMFSQNRPMDPFSNEHGEEIMKLKRPKKKRKKPIFKFNEQDSMEFSKPSSMEFGRHNSMEFPSVNMGLMKKNINFEKSYDELVHSAKKLADTIENISDNDETTNLEPEGRDKKLPMMYSYENDKFNFDDEMKLSQKDEDELDNLEKLENLSNFGGGSSSGSRAGGRKKSTHSDAFHDFDLTEKKAFSADNEKFGDLFTDKFSDLFKETNYKDSNDKYDDEDKVDDNYDKLYDKIIDNITGSGKKKDKKSDKYSSFNEALFDEGSNKKPSSSGGKKTNKKKTSSSSLSGDTDAGGGGEDSSTGSGSQFANENASDETASIKGDDEIKLTGDNEQTEYNTNNSGHTETGEYDYAGYANPPPSEEVVDGDAEKTDKAPSDGGGKYDEGKYQDDTQTTNPPASDHANRDSDYKEQPASPPSTSDGERTESEMRSFKNPSTSFRNMNSFPPFTRMTVKSRLAPSRANDGSTTGQNGSRHEKSNTRKPKNASRPTKLVKVRSKRIPRRQQQ